jgi:hypothetical protein
LSRDFETCGTLSVGSYSEEEPPESEDLLRKEFRTRNCEWTEWVDDGDFRRLGWEMDVFFFKWTDNGVQGLRL